MIERKDIEKLAALSRLRLSDAEAGRLEQEFEQILSYVSTITTASIPDGLTDDTPLQNVLRDDGVPHQTGAYTDALLRNAPRLEGNHIAVKKILG